MNEDTFAEFATALRLYSNITFEEALGRLVDDESFDAQFINNPNTGITTFIKGTREEAVKMLEAAPTIWLSGPVGQRTNYGIHIAVKGKMGQGDLFFPTKPKNVNN